MIKIINIFNVARLTTNIEQLNIKTYNTFTFRIKMLVLYYLIWLSLMISLNYTIFEYFLCIQFSTKSNKSDYCQGY